MRIVNHSKISIDRRLWKRLALGLMLEPELPAALADQVGLFEGPALRVFVYAPVKGKAEASYSCGRIDIWTCKQCTPAFVLSAYCHELVHSWYESFDRPRYFDEEVETVAEHFGKSVINRLGGEIGDTDRCSTYYLPGDYSLRAKKLFGADRSIRECLEQAVGHQRIHTAKMTRRER